MMSGDKTSWKALLLSGTMAATLLLGLGCQSPGGGAATADLRDDIVAIRQYYAAEPWIRDEEGRVTGIAARVYFVAPKTPLGDFKGVFVRGPIKASLYVLSYRPDGTYERKLAYEWTFTAQQAASFRIPQPSVMGYSYGLYLRWPPELDVMGREIQLMFSYRLPSGEEIARRGSRFRVPLPLGWSAPASRPASAPNAGASQPDRPPGSQ